MIPLVFANFVGLIWCKMNIFLAWAQCYLVVFSPNLYVLEYNMRGKETQKGN